MAGLGAFVGDLDTPFAGSPAAQDLARYRSRHDTGGILLVGGAALVLTGAIVENSGRDYINQAIWEYNRALAP